MASNAFPVAMFQSLILVSVAAVIATSAGVAPEDEEALCEQLRALGAAPTPAYSTNMRVLMDSWNYRNLLPPRTGAVWDQVDNDMNNGFTTNVSFIFSILNCSYAYGQAIYIYSGFSSPTLHVNSLSKYVGSVLVHRTTG